MHSRSIPGLICSFLFGKQNCTPVWGLSARAAVAMGTPRRALLLALLLLIVLDSGAGVLLEDGVQSLSGERPWGAYERALRTTPVHQASQPSQICATNTEHLPPVASRSRAPPQGCARPAAPGPAVLHQGPLHRRLQGLGDAVGLPGGSGRSALRQQDRHQEHAAR